MGAELKFERSETRKRSRWSALWELFAVSLKLGLTSFGGPTAHLGYFRTEYVHRRRWLDETAYAELVALCQFLPGPASSQVGMGIGIIRGGLLGGVAAWLGFTLPSALALAAVAYGVTGGVIGDAGWIHGLKLVAVAIVAHAVIGMATKLASGRVLGAIAAAASAAALCLPWAVTQIAIILVAGAYGAYAFRKQTRPPDDPDIPFPVSKRMGTVMIGLFGVLLLALPLLRTAGVGGGWLQLADSFYRAGALVFGGGHVVLPLLEQAVVPTGWMSPSEFIAGYGAAQAVPGPLFTFAAYLGTVIAGAGGAIVASIAIFLPAFLLIAGVLPFWNGIRRRRWMQGALLAVNASVVGILLAALYDPVWTSAVRTGPDFAVVCILFTLLTAWKLPPLVVVLVGLAAGVAMQGLPV